MQIVSASLFHLSSFNRFDLMGTVENGPYSSFPGKLSISFFTTTVLDQIYEVKDRYRNGPNG